MLIEIYNKKRPETGFVNLSIFETFSGRVRVGYCSQSYQKIKRTHKNALRNAPSKSYRLQALMIFDCFLGFRLIFFLRDPKVVFSGRFCAFHVVFVPLEYVTSIPSHST